MKKSITCGTSDLPHCGPINLLQRKKSGISRVNRHWGSRCHGEDNPQVAGTTVLPMPEKRKTARITVQGGGARDILWDFIRSAAHWVDAMQEFKLGQCGGGPEPGEETMELIEA